MPISTEFPVKPGCLELVTMAPSNRYIFLPAPFSSEIFQYNFPITLIVWVAGRVLPYPIIFIETDLIDGFFET